MQTLIIHPQDETTDFLCQIYGSITTKTVVRKFRNSEEIIELIHMADLVIMCGHGSSSGLLCGGSEDSCYIVDETLVSALKRKSNNIFLWCNAAEFVMEHDLCGLFSGMFISEVSEAMMFGIEASRAVVEESNQIFAEILRHVILSHNHITAMHSEVVVAYSALARTGNPIAAYNCARLYARSALDTELVVHRNTLRVQSAHRHIICWSGGCREKYVCDSCFYSASQILQPSYYHCTYCSWDICETCLSQHTDRSVIQRPDSTCTHMCSTSEEEVGVKYIALGVDTDLVHENVMLDDNKADNWDSTITCPSVTVAATIGNASSGPTYTLTYAAGHMFIMLPQGEFLVDTGCPLSFGSTRHLTYGPAYDVSIPQAVGGINLESIRGIPEVYARVVGILGMDAMLTGDVLWDGPSGCCSFNTPVHTEAIKIPYQLLSSYIMLDVDIMGASRRCLFDTGAQFGYVLDKDLVSEGVPADTIHDYNPLIGNIESASWLATVTLGGCVRVMERFGVLTGSYAEVLQLLGIDAILGVSWMPSKQIWFNPSESSLFIRHV